MQEPTTQNLAVFHIINNKIITLVDGQLEERIYNRGRFLFIFSHI